MKIVWNPWKLNDLCRSQHGTYFFMCGRQITFPSGFSMSCRQGSSFLHWSWLTEWCPAFPEQGLSSHPPAACLLWAGSVLYPLGWDDTAALLLPVSPNGRFLFSRSRRQSPRGCSAETLSKDYTAAHRPMRLGSQPPNRACTYVPAEGRRQEKQFLASLAVTVIWWICSLT